MMNHKHASLTNVLSGDKGDSKRTASWPDDEEEKSSYKKLKQDVNLDFNDDELDDNMPAPNNSKTVKSYNHTNDDIEDFSDDEKNKAPLPVSNKQTTAKSKDDSTPVRWFWKSDADWIEYDSDMAGKLEKEWQGSKQNVRVDNERFIDVKYMLQRRYDAPMKVRQVKREVAVKAPPAGSNNANKNFSSSSSSNNSNKSNYSNNSNNFNSSNSSNSSNNSKSASYANSGNKPAPTPVYSKTTNTANSTTKSQNDKPTSSGSGSTSGSASGQARWFWKSDKGDWEEYDAKVSSKLEKKYSQKLTNIQIDNDRYVDLKVWSQRRYDDPKKMRQIKREAPSTNKQNNSGNSTSSNTSASSKQNKNTSSNTASPAKKPTPKSNNSDSNQSGGSKDPIWWWQDDNDAWHKYDKAANLALELAFSQGSDQGRVDDERYVDFENMLQRRFDNENKKRYVKRQVMLTEAEKARIEKNRQEALKKLAGKGPHVSQPKIYSFLAKSSHQSSHKPKSDTPDNKGNILKFFGTKDQTSNKNNNSNNNNNNDTNDNNNDSDEDDIGKLMQQNKEIVELSDSSDEEDIENLDEKTKIDKKRQKYACGDDYITLSQLNSWEVSLLRLKIESDPASPYHENPNNEKYNKIISLWQGDITTLEIQAIVNAAKPSLLGGGGIDGAIHKAAGKGLVAECRFMYPDGCEIGESKITGGHHLPAQYVIHTVGPVGENNNKLRSCYESSLDLLKQNELRNIAFCCVSTGIYGFPNKKAALVALRTVREWLDKNGADSVDRIVFCVFLEKDFTIYSDFMPYFFPPASSTDGDN
eukprot:Phypoly_transcript_03279.p1 GENE.Phypoly_transcript_03279~~Phypoly_transcript_03279.p1  ORF type:complete len:809 (+),score=189.02 Phypoly_transcript_03279:38-2464(+)